MTRYLMRERSEARRLLEDSLVWDNHACMPLRPGDGSFLPELRRAKRAGVDVISLNVGFGPHTLDDHQTVLAWFTQWLTDHSDEFRIVLGVDEIDAARADDKMAVFFDIEGMAPFDNAGPEALEPLRRAGVGWMLVAYNRDNAAGGGCLDDDKGLTAHGRRMLAEMKRVGMIVCCSHTGHQTACQVMESADNPVIFSHSNADAVYSHPRNIPDSLIQACAQTGGVVGINGVGDFLGEGQDYAHLISRHVDHMVQLVGAEYVGIALDYVYDLQEVFDYIEQTRETFGEEMASQFSGRFAPPETIVEVTAKLLALGYSHDDIKNIVGRNWRRVAAAVWPDARSA